MCAEKYEPNLEEYLKADETMTPEQREATIERLYNLVHQTEKELLELEVKIAQLMHKGLGETGDDFKKTVHLIRDFYHRKMELMKKDAYLSVFALTEEKRTDEDKKKNK